MKVICAVLFLLAVGIPAVAQSPAASQKEAMKRLDSWVGRWKGEGWFDVRGQKTPFVVDESIQARLDGLALLVEGLGKAKGPDGSEGRVVHQALAMITYDDQAKRFRFTSTTAEGRYGEMELKVVDGGYQWGMQNPEGQGFRYSIKVTADEWFEYGEYSPDGKSWRRFHEMTLKRTN